MGNVEQKFLEEILRYLVTKPEDIKLDRTIDGMGVLYTLSVHDVDTFRIIGKEGQIINAVRVLLRAVGYAHQVRASLKLNINENNRIQKDGIKTS